MNIGLPGFLVLLGVPALFAVMPAPAMPVLLALIF